MYVGVSNSQIMPGLEMLGKLSLMDHERGAVDRRGALLSGYLKNAQRSINITANKVSFLSKICWVRVSMFRMIENIARSIHIHNL